MDINTISSVGSYKFKEMHIIEIQKSKIVVQSAHRQITLKSILGKFLASERARSSAVSSALIRATRITHHWGPILARLSRLSSSVQEAYLFLGFFISLSSTCSLQLVVVVLLFLLSFLSRLLSLAGS